MAYLPGSLALTAPGPAITARTTTTDWGNTDPAGQAARVSKMRRSFEEHCGRQDLCHSGRTRTEIRGKEMCRYLASLLLILMPTMGRSGEPSRLGYPDLSTFRQELFPPAMLDQAPAPGLRVRATLPEYRGTEVYYSLYLPADWAPGRRFPVIVEYAGNGNYRSKHGDVSTGRVEDSSLGYGLGGPSGFIWVCLPYVDTSNRQNQLQWWGDIAATVDFCKRAVRVICTEFGGDPDAVILCGFSRGAIACNYIGLHDDEIARLWRAFIAASHYDGVRTWNYAGSDRAAARKRLERLGGRPVLVTHEVYDTNPKTYSIVDTVNYLVSTGIPLQNFRFQTIHVRNHSDTWPLHDLPERAMARQWLQDVLTKP